MEDQPQEFRLRLPRKGELFGLVISMQGGARMIVQCQDGKERLCRVPGKIKRRIWVKEGDYVLVVPWAVQGDERADVAYRYTSLQADHLRRRGFLKEFQ
ncbi:translation initiation factor eIF-1A [Candidatus Micrarchaeota archaeon]|nr:translation initiation factor eIF-1A [Candidatus Micrarchaeota archaeon]